MSKRAISSFIAEVPAKPPKKNYITNKANVYQIDDTWSLDILDLGCYGPQKSRGYRYVLVLIDNFSKSGRTSPSETTAQILKDSFENILIISNVKPILNATDVAKSFVNKIFANLQKNKSIENHSRNTS